MFEMGFWEIALIFILLLVIVGPERLPKLARTVGLWLGKARSMVSAMKHEVEQELKLDEVRRSLAQQTHADEFKRLADQVRSINADVKSVGHDTRAVLEKTPPTDTRPGVTDAQPSESATSAPASNPPPVK